MKPIDAVYTWVDDNDPKWRTSMNTALNDSGFTAETLDHQSRRFRNHDELRFSLRSLDRYAPWIRNIYLVTSGQTPAWLKRDHPRMRLVSHQEIFPDGGCLPTFNSNAIEMNLHRIPGLSRKFLYLNDDLFFGRACGRDDFQQESSDVCYFEKINLDSELDAGSPGDLACAHTLEAMKSHTGSQPLTWMPAHVPQIYDRVFIEELERHFPGKFSQTRANQFRSPTDFVLRIAYASMTSRHGNISRLLSSGSGDFSFLRLQPEVFKQLRSFMAIYQIRPKYFCLNDDLLQGLVSALVSKMMNVFLRIYFRGKSGFETGNGGVE